MKNNLLNIGVVIIGRNEGERLLACIKTAKQQCDKIFYVDSGSTDSSCEEATKLDVDVVRLDMTLPFTAARARNHGFYELIKKYPNIEYVQFVDGDCELSADWLDVASKFLLSDSNIAAVTGVVSEKNSDRNIYHRIAKVEWRLSSTAGKSDVFGGIVMIRVDSFKQVSGYNNNIVAAEDDELSLRIKRQGKEIYCLDYVCAFHDIRMNSLSQWWVRARRAGYAYANLSSLYGLAPERKFVKERRRVFLWGFLMPLLAFSLTKLTNGYSLYILCKYPLSVLKIYYHTNYQDLDYKDKLSWGLSCAFSVFPQFIGLVYYYYSRVNGKIILLNEKRLQS